MKTSTEERESVAVTSGGNILYDACVGFMVSERTGTESWELVAKWVAERRGNGADVPSIKAEFAVVEKQIKSDFKVATLPGAWRSAKSAALSAVKAGVPILRDDGTVKPKTELTNAIKGAKPAAVPRNDSFAFVTQVEKAEFIACSIAGECSIAGPIDRAAWDRMDIVARHLLDVVEAVPHA